MCVYFNRSPTFSGKLCSPFFPSSQFLIIMFNLFSLSFHILIMRNDVCVLLNIGYVSNETNKDVHMYINRIYSSRYLDTLLHKVEMKILYGNYIGIYTIATIT